MRCHVSPPRIQFCDHFKPSFQIKDEQQADSFIWWSSSFGDANLGKSSGEWNRLLVVGYFVGQFLSGILCIWNRKNSNLLISLYSIIFRNTSIPLTILSLPTVHLFAGAADSFGFWNDLKEDDIDNCAGCNACNIIFWAPSWQQIKKLNLAKSEEGGQSGQSLGNRSPKPEKWRLGGKWLGR